MRSSRMSRSAVPRAASLDKRRSDAVSASLVGRAFWLLIHAAVLAAVLRWSTVVAGFYSKRQWAPLVLYGMAILANAALYYSVSVFDPGYVAPNGPPPLHEARLAEQEALEEQQCAEPAAPEPSGRLAALSSPEAHEAPETESADGGQSARLLRPPVAPEDIPQRAGRRCRYCSAWQALRTKHCHECNRCVAKFDHHCHWVGACVGARNHRVFLSYLYSQSIVAAWTLAWAVDGFQRSPETDTWVAENLMLLVSAITTGGFLIFLLALTVMHTYLALTNQTTWEAGKRATIPYLRGVPPNVAPFNRGVTHSAAEFCCPPGDAAYQVPSRAELHEAATRETFFDNRLWTCI